MACAVHVWELVLPMAMAEKLANVPLSRYMQVGGPVCRGLAMHII